MNQLLLLTKVCRPYPPAMRRKQRTQLRRARGRCPLVSFSRPKHLERNHKVGLNDRIHNGMFWGPHLPLNRAPISTARDEMLTELHETIL